MSDDDKENQGVTEAGVSWIRIQSDDPEGSIINLSDFDEKKHKRFGEASSPAPKLKPSTKPVT